MLPFGRTLLGCGVRGYLPHHDLSYGHLVSVYNIHAVLHRVAVHALAKHQPVNEVAIDSSGCVWVATGGGLYRIGSDGKGAWVMRRTAVVRLAVFGGDRMLVGTDKSLATTSIATANSSTVLLQRASASAMTTHRQRAANTAFQPSIRLERHSRLTWTEASYLVFRLPALHLRC